MTKQAIARAILSLLAIVFPPSALGWAVQRSTEVSIHGDAFYIDGKHNCPAAHRWAFPA